MKVMKHIKDDEFDLAIVDPPYGIGINKMNMGGRLTIRPDKSKIWDESVPCDNYFSNLNRVSQNQIIWGGELF